MLVKKQAKRTILIVLVMTKRKETILTMKQFFEEYGGVALGILALLVLIAMITPVGNIIKSSLQGIVNKFSSSMNSQLDEAMNSTKNAQNSANTQ